MSVFNRHAGKDETIVLLQDEHAVWSRWRGDQLIDRRVILHGDNNTDADLIPFEGLTAMMGRFKRPVLSLILDSSLDEVSYLAGTRFHHGLLRMSNDIEPVHESLNQRCQIWLKEVQEQGVVFDCVVSTLRLLLTKYRKIAKQTLIVVDDDQLIRHVLFHRGRIVYARQCHGVSDGVSHAALAESLEYLDGSASAMLSHDCEIVYLGSDLACLDLLNKTSTGSVVHEASKTVTEWYFELFRRQRWRMRSRMLNRQLNHILNGQLDKSISRRQLRHSERKRYLATRLTIFMALTSFIVAGVHGFIVARYLRNIKIETASISDEILLARQSAADIHTSPLRAAESIARLELFHRIERLETAAMLTLIADAVTRHPEIMLDRLEWLMTDNAEALQWISVTSLENAPVPSGIRQVLNQSLDNTEELQIRTGTQIALEGSVKEVTLRGRQAVFEKFISSLESSPAIASVEVVISPLEYAVSSEVDDSDSRFSVQIFQWSS